MRIMNSGGRLSLLATGGLADVEALSDGRFGPDIQEVYDRWEEFRSWASAHAGGNP
jgi:hypothetical protein